MRSYLLPSYSVIIPWVASEFATVWHPVDRVGTFAVIQRGAFATEKLAVEWAQKRLNGCPYSVRRNVCSLPVVCDLGAVHMGEFGVIGRVESGQD